MSNINLTEAIRAGIITFEQALELSTLAGEVSAETAKEPAKKAKKAPKKAAQTPKTEEPKAEEPKTEEPKAEFSYTKGGAVIQYAGHHTLKAGNLRRVNNAMAKLVEAGFCVSWKRVGGWVYIYHDKSADKKTAAEFKAAAMTKGWTFVNKRGAWVDSEMLKDYADNFKA